MCCDIFFSFAWQYNMVLVFNPSPMDDKISTYPLEYVDYFLLNEIEAGDICGEQGSGEELLQKLSDKFPESKIVLTLGGDGSLYRDGQRILTQGIYKVPVADTTAAGDTFTVSTMAGLVRGWMRPLTTAPGSHNLQLRPRAAPPYPQEKVKHLR